MSGSLKSDDRVPELNGFGFGRAAPVQIRGTAAPARTQRAMAASRHKVARSRRGDCGARSCRLAAAADPLELIS